jgi:hypothetical protein
MITRIHCFDERVESITDDEQTNFQLTSRPTTQGFCELLNDAAEAAINDPFFRGWSRKPDCEQKP